MVAEKRKDVEASRKKKREEGEGNGSKEGRGKHTGRRTYDAARFSRAGKKDGRKAERSHCT